MKLSRTVLSVISGVSFLGSGWLLYDAAQTRYIRDNPLITTGYDLPQFSSGARLSALAQAYLVAGTPDFDKARIATERSIAINPRRLENWNRLAFIETQEKGWLTPKAQAAIEESLRLSPYGDTAVLHWRLEFANRYWVFLSSENKAIFRSQLAFIKREAEHKTWINTFSKIAN